VVENRKGVGWGMGGKDEGKGGRGGGNGLQVRRELWVGVRKRGRGYVGSWEVKGWQVGGYG